MRRSFAIVTDEEIDGISLNYADRHWYPLRDPPRQERSRHPVTAGPLGRPEALCMAVVTKYQACVGFIAQAWPPCADASPANLNKAWISMSCGIVSVGYGDSPASFHHTSSMHVSQDQRAGFHDGGHGQAAGLKRDTIGVQAFCLWPAHLLFALLTGPAASGYTAIHHRGSYRQSLKSVYLALKWYQ